jgi:hypothetical protein
MYRVAIPEEYTDVELMNWISLGTGIAAKEVLIYYSGRDRECFVVYYVIFSCQRFEEYCLNLEKKLRFFLTSDKIQVGQDGTSGRQTYLKNYAQGHLPADANAKADQSKKLGSRQDQEKDKIGRKFQDGKLRHVFSTCWYTGPEIEMVVETGNSYGHFGGDMEGKRLLDVRTSLVDATEDK